MGKIIIMLLVMFGFAGCSDSTDSTEVGGAEKSVTKKIVTDNADEPEVEGIILKDTDEIVFVEVANIEVDGQILAYSKNMPIDRDSYRVLGERYTKESPFPADKYREFVGWDKITTKVSDACLKAKNIDKSEMNNFLNICSKLLLTK